MIDILGRSFSPQVQMSCWAYTQRSYTLLFFFLSEALSSLGKSISECSVAKLAEVSKVWFLPPPKQDNNPGNKKIITEFQSPWAYLEFFFHSTARNASPWWWKHWYNSAPLIQRSSSRGIQGRRIYQWFIESVVILLSVLLVIISPFVAIPHYLAILY